MRERGGTGARKTKVEAAHRMRMRTGVSKKEGDVEVRYRRVTKSLDVGRRTETPLLSRQGEKKRVVDLEDNIRRLPNLERDVEGLKEKKGH